MITKKGLMIGALVLAIAMAASAAYAGSALQLYTNCGVDYIKHVNFLTPTSATTTLLLKKVNGEGTVQIKIPARATDGSTLSQYRTI